MERVWQPTDCDGYDSDDVFQQISKSQESTKKHGNGTTSGNNNDGWFGQQGRTWNVDANPDIKNVDAPSDIDMENTDILICLVI